MSAASTPSPEALPAAAAVLDAADALAARIAPGAVARDADGGVPRDALAALDGSGLLAVTVPARFGGPGGGPATLTEVVRRVAVADPAVAQVPQGHFLFVDVLAAIGSEDQQARLFADVLAGRRIGNALAERGTAHAQALRTRLEADGAGLRLRGAKAYATGALSAAWIAVSAIDADDRLVVAFVERDADGVEADDAWHAMGQRATVSGTVTFDDVAVDPALVLDYQALFEAPQLVGARAQLVHAALEAGIARAAVSDAATFLRERSRPFFEAVASGVVTRATDDPYALHRLGEHGARASAAEALLARAATQVERLGLRPEHERIAAEGSLAVAEAKAFASEVAVAAASDLFAICGASATDRRLGLDRHWRNARTHSVHDPVAWKHHHLGAFLAEGRLPPNHGQL